MMELQDELQLKQREISSSKELCSRLSEEYDEAVKKISEFEKELN